MSDRAWVDWGAKHPYFGVLTDDRFRSQSIEANRDTFFATGEAFIDRILATAERVFGPIAPRRALDFGCGVGRLTLPLARRFDEAVGIDISPGMLAEARTNAARASLDNTRFEPSDDRLSAATGTFDFINSYIVLQHIPVVRGLPIMAALLDRLAAGGTAFLHFSVHRRSGLIGRASYFVRHRLPFGSALVNLVKGQPVGDAPMEMNEYPLASVIELLERHGIVETYLISEVHNGVTTVGMLAHRPPRSPAT